LLPRLVAVGREGLRDLGIDLGRRSLLCLGKLPGGQLLALVIGGALRLAPLLESRNNVLVLPTNFMAETAHSAVLASGLEPKNTEGLRNNHLLLLVVRRRNALEDLEALKGGSAASGLMGDHATDSLVEDTGGSAEVEGTAAGGVVPGHLAKIGMVLELSAEELARDVQGLAADDDNLLAAKELLGDNAGQAAKQVALAIDHNLYERVQRSAICNSSFCTLRFRYGVANLDAARLRSWSLGLEKTNRSDGDVKMVMPRTALNKVPIFRMKIKRIHTYHRLERRHFAGGELGKTGK